MAKVINLNDVKPAKLHDVELKDVQLVHLVEYDPDAKKMQVPKTIGYYRQPGKNEYPLNLSKGYDRYIHRVWSDHSESPHDRVLYYLMQQKNAKLLMEQNDFCLNRQTITRIMDLILTMDQYKVYCKNEKKDFVAVRFKKCIFLHLCTEYKDDQVQSVRNTFAFKARQYLFADTPGSVPNTDLPVDENRQLYGTFSAKLENFRLLYSGEISGVENTESLGDLTDPKVLKQCRLASVKVFSNEPGGRINWRTNWRIRSWLLQAYVAGIKQQRVAIFDKDGLVHQPIDGDGISQLEYLNRFKMTKCTEILHRFLSQISQIVGDIDCPHTVFEFTLEGPSLIYKGKKSKTNSSLTEEFVLFANRI